MYVNFVQFMNVTKICDHKNLRLYDIMMTACRVCGTLMIVGFNFRQLNWSSKCNVSTAATERLPAQLNLPRGSLYMRE